MSTNPAQHDHAGAQAPRVIVRAEKHFLCTACGTLVEIPADVVGQLVYAVESSPPPQPAEHSPPPTEPKQPAPTRRSYKSPSRSVANRSPRSNPNATRPPRPRRPQSPQPRSFHGKIIDGLTVPSGRQLDHAFKWISFHLKVLDGHGTEIKRLKKLIKTERLKTESTNRVPRPSPLGRANAAATSPQTEQENGAKPKHAQEDLGVAPGAQRQKERGPP